MMNIDIARVFDDVDTYPGSDQFVALDISGDAAIITLRRPERLNAASPELIWALANALRTVLESDMRVVTLRGDGRAFCAGHDLKAEPIAPGSAALTRHLGRLQYISAALRSSSIISIADVHGYAVGAGLELALSCDFVVLDRETMLRFPEVEVGLSVTGGISYYLPQIVGLAAAKELMLLGEPFTAARAYELGLVYAVVDAADREQTCATLVTKLLAQPRHALGLAKSSLESVHDADAEEAMQREIENGMKTGGTDDAEAARMRFGK